MLTIWLYIYVINQTWVVAIVLYFKTRENEKQKKRKAAFTYEIHFTFSNVAPRDHFRTGPVINPPTNVIANCWVNEKRSSREMGGDSRKVLIICKWLAAESTLLKLRQWSTPIFSWMISRRFALLSFLYFTKTSLSN